MSNDQSIVMTNDSLPMSLAECAAGVAKQTRTLPRQKIFTRPTHHDKLGLVAPRAPPKISGWAMCYLICITSTAASTASGMSRSLANLSCCLPECLEMEISAQGKECLCQDCHRKRHSDSQSSTLLSIILSGSTQGSHAQCCPEPRIECLWQG